MNYNDEEVELITEWHALRKEFVAAKEFKTLDPERYREAQRAMSSHRAKWRGIREYLKLPLPQDQDPDGTAAPAPITVTSAVNTPGGKAS